MPDWVIYVILAAVGAAGFFLVIKSREDYVETTFPSERAFIEVNFRQIDANKEVALREIELEHEEEMAVIARGTYDNIGVEYETEDDDGGETLTWVPGETWTLEAKGEKDDN